MRESKTHQDWLIEGVVIVLSILLAFAVDAAWDARSERNREALIREALVAEFETVKELLPAHVEMHRRTLESTRLIIDLVAKAEEGTRVTVPADAIQRAIRNGSFDAPTGALDALLSSGDLKLISDPELRRMLAAWPSRLHDAIEDDRMLREFWSPDLRQILARDINLIELYKNIQLAKEQQADPPGISILVTNPLRGGLPDISGSSRLAYEAESDLITFVDELLERLRGGDPRHGS